MRIFILFLALLSPIFVFGQNSFIVQKSGDFLTEDGKDYFVVEFEGKSQEELYKQVLVNVHKMYVSPKDVLSSVEYESISINAITDPVYYDRVLVSAFSRKLDYTITVQFKDGRLRVNAPVINACITKDEANVNGFSRSNHFWDVIQNSTKLFDKDGSVNKKKVDKFNAINETINGLITALVFGTNEEDDDDW